MTSKTLPEVRKARLPYIDRSREMAWLVEHEQEYAGQWCFSAETALSHTAMM